MIRVSVMKYGLCVYPLKQETLRKRDPGVLTEQGRPYFALVYKPMGTSQNKNNKYK